MEETVLAAHGRSRPFFSSEKILKVSVKHRKLCKEWCQENLHEVTFEEKGKKGKSTFLLS